MSGNTKLKKLIRERMKRTGETYSTARMHLLDRYGDPMTDSTEQVRREMTEDINSNASERRKLEEKYGEVWDTDEATRDFTFLSFGAPFTVVIRKSDGQKGSLMFQHSPRFYFSFSPA